MKKNKSSKKIANEFQTLFRVVIRDIMETSGVADTSDAAERLEAMVETFRETAALLESHAIVCNEMLIALKRAGK